MGQLRAITTSAGRQIPRLRVMRTCMMLTLTGTTFSSDGAGTRAGVTANVWHLAQSSSTVVCSKLQCSYTFSMSTLRFEWDERKAAANAKKHGVSFEEAKSVFVDEQAKLIDDPDHRRDEDRFVLLGLAAHPAACRLPLLSGRRQHHSLHLCRKATTRIQVLSVEVPHAQSTTSPLQRKNPYAAQLKKQITIRLDEESIAYFKTISEDVGIPYQSLINLYLGLCGLAPGSMNLNWK